MRINKRQFLVATGTAFAALSQRHVLAARSEGENAVELASMTDGAIPISADEHRQRIQKAAQLMRANDVAALVVESGSALTYFTGIRWWRSERFVGAVIMADGRFCIVAPFFEEPSIREQMQFGDDVRTWHEDENPFEQVADFIGPIGAKARIAVEETVRYFIVDGIDAAMPKATVVSGAAITRGCRMIKSKAELALMQVANDVTLRAYEHIYPRVVPGMTPGEVSSMMNDATRQLGGTPTFAIALFGPASAYPHGTRQPQVVEKGGIVLMDCGCSVHGYQSDISRTWVVGKPSPQQQRVWQTVKRGQELALETIRPGVAAGAVDQTVRQFYADTGFGPGYQAPGLTHRLGHGIGMDGHEPINFVGNEQTPIAPGMCFSNEPGMYLPGEFGVRLEDCLYVDDKGPVLFTPLTPSLAHPFG